jgi:hypothetical protein
MQRILRKKDFEGLEQRSAMISLTLFFFLKTVNAYEVAIGEEEEILVGLFVQ